MSERFLPYSELQPFPPPIFIENPTFTLPNSAAIPNPEYLVPDQILARAIDRWGLAIPGVRTIDPLCGTGRFADKINVLGGCCDAIELLEGYYEIARRTITPGSVPIETPVNKLSQPKFGGRVVASEVLLGNALYTLPPLGHPHAYHGVCTSPPFSLLDKPEIILPLLAKITAMPMHGGFIVIDSAETAVRDGVVCRPADQTIALMWKCGYALRDRLIFNTVERPGCDTQFSELYFRRFGDL